MQNLLTNNTHDDDYTKAQLYSQAFQRYLTMADKFRNKPLGKFEVVDPKQTNEMTPDPSTTENADKRNTIAAKRILQSTLPPTLRSKGLNLLEHLSDLPGVSWDSKQQLVVDDKTITQSNIVDLVNDLVRDRKTTPPKGWNELSNVLTKSNVPKALIAKIVCHGLINLQDGKLKKLIQSPKINQN